MSNDSYLALWQRARGMIESQLEGAFDPKDLDQITKLLERVQKGEEISRQSAPGGVQVVNIRIPGVDEEDAE
ncbi:MAG: hypothetical protein M5R36_07100 [Deltaproteobacteria bacterium]|nr:hypothetical protein [Deltaproteobacteria bacterium]